MNRPVNGPLPAPGRTRLLAFGSSAGAVRRSREFTRDALVSWHWLPAAAEEQRTAEEQQTDQERRTAAEDVLLMVSELVTNACRHAPGGVRELRLNWDGVRLRAEVADACPIPPGLLRSAAPGWPGGHGLRVVDRLARAWGWAPEGRGKRVWLEVPAPPDRHAHRARRVPHIPHVHHTPHIPQAPRTHRD
ncbi:ATP-binding protein [Kitasatospora sp. NPDC093806]|uniref:ATP-binding protein n=1 Tax=Kitasatospora sp. NPDC093806 TaxID=3155075 RepID=UPI0034190CAA